MFWFGVMESFVGKRFYDESEMIKCGKRRVKADQKIWRDPISYQKFFTRIYGCPGKRNRDFMLGLVHKSQSINRNPISEKLRANFFQKRDLAHKGVNLIACRYPGC